MKPPYVNTAKEELAIGALAEQIGLGMHMVGILYGRGYDTPEKIDKFLHPGIADLNSPFLMAGMYQAVARIKHAINSSERIGIFADSDLDGITALALLHSLLTRMNIRPFIRYLKDDETYGLTCEIVEEFHANRVTLIITVDSGIRDVMEIAHARSLGIDVIVSDHHEQDESLPDAIIVNPKTNVCTYPFKHLAGVGIAFKICHALLLSYLPSFNRLFVLVARSGGLYHVSFIRNCIIEQIKTEADIGRVIDLLNTLAENDIVIAHEIGELEKISFPSNHSVVYRFHEFIDAYLKSGESSWDRMHTSLTGRKYPNPPVGFLNAVFLELEMFVPGKITEFIRSAIGLVAIGTVADVMPLIEENRILVKIGLEELNKKKQTALSLLSRNERINSKTIGWGIAPLLNTPGRVGKTSLTVSFFTENDPDKLQAIITEIIQLNDTRKNTINNLHAKLMNDIEIENMMENEKIIYIKTDEIHDGYAGLMANRIADVTDKPVILVALPGKNGIVKGSCRVKSHINFFSHVKQFSDRFEKIGGHENAFGFTANALHIDDIIQSIKDSFSIDPVRKSDIAIDAELDVDLINVDFIRELEIFEPYGNANPEPVFISRNMEFESCTIFGNNHGKFLLAKNNLLTAIGWGMGLIMKDYYNARRPIDLIYRLENNEYRGSLYPRMIVIDMLYSKK